MTAGMWVTVSARAPEQGQFARVADKGLTMRRTSARFCPWAGSAAYLAALLPV
jgi:hypothetical protein